MTANSGAHREASQTAVADGLAGTEGRPPRLSCAGVTVQFGGLTAVNDVDLAVPGGAIVGLVGPNGAGKTTLFGVLSGLLRPSHGRVLLDGDDVTDTRPQVRAARGLARTFQHPELFTGLSVRDHLVLAFRAKHTRRRIWTDLVAAGSLRRPRAEEDAAVDELIHLLGLDSVAGRPALGLPLGVARMVEVGRALAASPTVLLLDEPSSGLDSSETEQFGDTLQRIGREQDISVLLVEHDVDLVMRVCSQVSVLDFGVVIASGTPADIRADASVRAAYLGEELPAGHATFGADSVRADDLHSQLAPEPSTHRGALPSEAPPSGAPPSGAPPSGAPPSGASKPLLAVNDLRVRYGEALALSGVSFTLERGRALAVLGANGAGKSTLARALSGLVPVADGTIRLGADDIGTWPAHRIRRAGIVHLPEGRGVFRGLTVEDNLRMAASAVGGRAARRDALARAYELFPALAGRRRQLAGLLSGGEQQMLSLARSLSISPQLVIADELSLGLAPMLVDQVFDGLARARQTGVTLIMIEQYVHRALDFADECLILQRGHLAWSGTARGALDEVLRHYLGDAMSASS
jgi:branched-chain amino acid transport system ATP-binding protein